MTGKKPIKDYELKKAFLIMEQDGCCGYCGEPFKYGQKIDLSHRIPRTKANIRLYGYIIIDHVKNLVATHQNGYKGRSCNDSVGMNTGSQPMACAELIEEIKKELNHV